MLSASASVRVSAQQTQAQPEAPEVHEHVDVAGTLLTPTTDFSGTAWLPKATPMLGLHRSWREWDLRLDGTMFVQFLYEPGDRHRTGAAANHQLVSPNWVMGMARRRVGTGRFGLRTMLSAEPWTHASVDRVVVTWRSSRSQDRSSNHQLTRYDHQPTTSLDRQIVRRSS